MKSKAKVPTLDFKEILIANIVIGKTNPRKFFDDKSLKELADSISEKGVLQPILVRPLPKGKFELVYGERRVRASKLAKRKSINSIVRELTDEQVLDIQIIENTQREDVHPLDEAAAIKVLIDRGDSKDDVAKRLGVSLKYITHRMQLNELIPQIAEIYYQDRMKISIALNLATLVAESQIEYFDTCLKDWKEDENFNLKSLNHHFNRLQGKLSSAPFELTNPSLNNKSACNDCPLNSINKGLLFQDKDSEPICLDVGCFKGKVRHHRKNLLEAAKLNDTPIVSNGYINNSEEVLSELEEHKLVFSKGEVIYKPVMMNFDEFVKDGYYHLDEEDEDYKQDLAEAQEDFKVWKSDTEEEIKEFNLEFENGKIIEGLKVEYNGELKKVLVKIENDEVTQDDGEEIVENKNADLDKAKSLEVRRRELDYEKMQTELITNLKEDYISINKKLALDEKIAFAIALLSKLPWDSNAYLLLSCKITGHNRASDIYDAYRKDSKNLDKDIALLSRMLIADSNYHDTSSIRKSKTALSLYEAFKSQLAKKVDDIENAMKKVQDNRQVKFAVKLKNLVPNVEKFLKIFNKDNPL